ncbi:MAG: TolC family protein [Niabella sp.]
MIKGFFLFISVLTVGMLQGRAQRLLTLEEAIATTLQNNFQIQLARNDSMIAAIDYGYRDAVFLPSLNATIGRTFSSNSQRQTLADSSERKSNNVRSNNIQGNVALNWVLFDGLKMFATREKADALLEAGTYTAREQVINTVATVINTYYSVARQQQLVKATDMQIKLNEERVKLAQYNLDIGTGAKPDVLQSRVDLNAQKVQKMQQQTTIAQLKEQLAQAMNSGIKPEEFELRDSIPLGEPISLGSLYEGLETANPAMLLAKSQIRIAELSLKESLADRYPVVSFNSAYNYSRLENNRAVNPSSLLFNKTYGYNFGFSASIPIFNQFRVKRQIQQDRLNLRYQNTLYDNQLSILRLSVTNAWQDYEQQRRILSMEEENIVYAEELVNIEMAKYRMGMATMVQLREAQLSLSQAYDRLIAARYNYKTAETELLRLRGTLL